MLYPACLRIVAHAEEAEEAMHDTLLHYFSFPGRFDSEAQKRSWLFKVAVSKSIDRWRKKRSGLLGKATVRADDTQLLIPADDALPGEEDAYQSDTATRNKVRQIKEAMTLLPPGYRTVLSLFLFEGYDFDEIAHILSLRPATVRSQYVRGRDRLRALLQINTNG